MKLEILNYGGSLNCFLGTYLPNNRHVHMFPQIVTNKNPRIVLTEYIIVILTIITPSYIII